MALIKCWECQKEISNTAQFCPACGAKKNKFFSMSLLLIIAFILFFFVDLSNNFTATKALVEKYNNDGYTMKQDIHAIRNVLSPTLEQQKINQQRSAEQDRILQQKIQAQYKTTNDKSQMQSLIKSLNGN